MSRLTVFSSTFPSRLTHPGSLPPWPASMTTVFRRRLLPLSADSGAGKRKIRSSDRTAMPLI